MGQVTPDKRRIGGAGVWVKVGGWGELDVRHADTATSPERIAGRQLLVVGL